MSAQRIPVGISDGPTAGPGPRPSHGDGLAALRGFATGKGEVGHEVIGSGTNALLLYEIGERRERNGSENRDYEDHNGELY